MIIENSAMLNIDLNAKNNDGLTAFHYACTWGNTSIVEMMINNSESLKLDLDSTGFQWAQGCGRTDVVNLIRRKMPQIANSKNPFL